jgi:hypothetical protein
MAASTILQVTILNISIPSPSTLDLKTTKLAEGNQFSRFITWLSKLFSLARSYFPYGIPLPFLLSYAKGIRFDDFIFKEQNWHGRTKKKKKHCMEMGRHTISVLAFHFWALRGQWPERKDVIIMATQWGNWGERPNSGESDFRSFQINVESTLMIW